MENKLTKEDQEIIKTYAESLFYWFEIYANFNDGPMVQDILEEMLFDIKNRTNKN
jgi:hypothetical protein